MIALINKRPQINWRDYRLEEEKIVIEKRAEGEDLEEEEMCLKD